MDKNSQLSHETSIEYKKVMNYLSKYKQPEETEVKSDGSPSKTRIELLKKIQNLCQDEDNYFEFEKVLGDYIGSSIEPPKSYKEIHLKQEKQEQQFPKDYSCEDLTNVFTRLTIYQKQKQEISIKSTLNSEKTTDVTGIKRSNALYNDFKDRQDRKQKQPPKPIKANLGSSYITHSLVYKKLEKDISKAVDFVLEHSECQNRLINIKQLAWLLNILNVFTEILEKKEKKNVKLSEERMAREEDFLFKIWYLINPSMSETVQAKIVQDFIQLVYDPYLTGSNIEEWAFQQKIDLTQAYVIELNKIGLRPNEENPGPTLLELPGLISCIILELRDLTQNFLSYRLTSKGLKIPNARKVRMHQEAYKECTFNPRINKQSEKIEREKQEEQQYFHQKSILSGHIVSSRNMSSSNISRRQPGKIVKVNNFTENSEIDLTKRDLESRQQQRVQSLLQKQQLRDKKVKLMQMIQREKENESCTFKPNLKRANSDFEISRVPNEVHDRLLKWGNQQKKNKDIMEQYNQALKVQQEMEDCTFQPQRRPPAAPRVLMKSSTNVKIPGHDQFLKRQKDAYRLKKEKEEAFQNIGRKKKNVAQTLETEPERKNEAPLFDIELNIGDECVKFCLRRGEDYKVKVGQICHKQGLDQATRATVEKIVLNYMVEQKILAN